MKKITLLLILLTVSFGYSQTYDLLTNGDFENGTDPWAWAGDFSVVSGEAFFSTTNAGGNLWDTQLVHGGLAFVNAKEYVLTFYARAAADRNITVAIQNVGPWNDQFRQDFAITTTMTMYTATFNATSDNGNVQIGFLMAGTGSTDAVYYDDISLVTAGTAPETCNDGILNNGETETDCGGPNCSACPNPPASAPTTPPNRAPADVISIYSDNYTDETTEQRQAFGGSVVTDLDYSGNSIISATTPVSGAGFQYQYFENLLDLTDFDYMHIDFYFEGTATAEGTVFLVIAQYTDGTNIQKTFDVTSLAPGIWHEMDIPFTGFDTNGSNPRDAIRQVIVQTAGPDVYGPFYADNIYFHKNTVLSTEDFNKTSFKVFPNPTQNSWTVKTANVKMSSIQVFDILGKNVLSLSPNTSETVIDGSSLKSGLYFAQIKTATGISSMKLIKN